MKIDHFNHEVISRKELKKINGGGDGWVWWGTVLGCVIGGIRDTMDAMVEHTVNLPTTPSMMG